ncbi:MAG TPA: hypothetical protein VIM11_10595 [Tepidisphaeraceae bacterium]|jgi:hypothetical protein
MGIRITEQGGDQHTQNPPPDHDTGCLGGQTKAVATQTVSAADCPTVLRGPQSGKSLGFVQYDPFDSAPPVGGSGITQASGGKTDMCSPTPGPSETLCVPTAATGFVRRDTGATQRIGKPEDHQVRKVSPRWTLAALNIASQISGAQFVSINKNKSE